MNWAIGPLGILGVSHHHFLEQGVSEFMEKTICDLIAERYLKYEVLADNGTICVLWIEMPTELFVDRLGVILCLGEGEDIVPLVCEYVHKTEAIKKAAWLLQWERLGILLRLGSNFKEREERIDCVQKELSSKFLIYSDIEEITDASVLWRTPCNIWVSRDSPRYQEAIDCVEEL